MARALIGLLVGLAVLVWGGWAVSERVSDLTVRSPVEGKRLPARPSPVRIDAAKLDAILEASPWVSPGLEGPVLWNIGFRACSDCIAFKETTFPALHAAGVDTRVMLYAPISGTYEAGAPEKAVLAELVATRDWALYEAWYESSAPAYYASQELPPAVEGNPEREAAIAAGRAAHDAVADVFAANGWDMERPALLWKDEAGRWMVFMGDTPRGRRLITRALGLD